MIALICEILFCICFYVYPTFFVIDLLIYPFYFHTIYLEINLYKTSIWSNMFFVIPKFNENVFMSNHNFIISISYVTIFNN